jgi:2-polyprenyl-3-methyl-5-hydroxy-6-metoxy-1,4-benzoquinol methylase
MRGRSAPPLVYGAVAAPESNERFAFGENWQRFLSDVDDERIAVAETSLREKLGLDDLRGLTFVDAGCGSGLFSLAAARLGARRIHSFDYDEDSVVAAQAMRDRLGAPETWTVERGDVTDAAYVASLGTFDVVYSWGVLHHTGAMWHAIENACALVAPGGRLFISIYNDQRWLSAYWRAIKRSYNRLPARARTPYVVAVMTPPELAFLARQLVRGRVRGYVQTWTRSRERGMSKWRDMVDWVGGYPFEVAKPEEVFRFCRDHGFVLQELETVGGGLGTNQFVFRRDAASESERSPR